jgi:hypothetical protein
VDLACSHCYTVAQRKELLHRESTENVTRSSRRKCRISQRRRLLHGDHGENAGLHRESTEVVSRRSPRERGLHRESMEIVTRRSQRKGGVTQRKGRDCYTASLSELMFWKSILFQIINTFCFFSFEHQCSAGRYVYPEHVVGSKVHFRDGSV